jgi:hypothetical protein
MRGQISDQQFQQLFPNNFPVFCSFSFVKFMAEKKVSGIALI